MTRRGPLATTSVALAGMAAAVLFGPLAGCADERHDASATTTATSTTAASTAPTVKATPGPLSAGIAEYREDEVTGTLQVELRNNRDQPISVRSLALSWSGLEPQAAVDPDYTLFRGVTVALPATVGRAVCPARGKEPDPSTAVALVGGSEADGSMTTYQVPVTRGLDVLERIHARSCEQQAVEKTVHISFGPTWTRTTINGVPALAGTVVAERTERPDPVVVSAVRQNGVLFNIDTVPAGREPVLDLGRGVQRAEAPVAIVAARCYGHALGDAKKIYEFHANLSVAGTDESVDFSIPVADQTAAYAIVNDTCQEAH